MTERDLEKLRKKMIEELKRLGIKWSYITCDYCPDKHRCLYAYDTYNTDGDCIAIK